MKDRNIISVFVIRDLKNEKIYYVRNKKMFCIDNNLTLRLLDYTKTGQRTHHKGFTVDNEKMIFIPQEDGNVFLYETGESGIIITNEEFEKLEFNEQKKDEVSIGVEYAYKDDNDNDETIEKELGKAYKTIQKLRDQLRIARKVNRANHRNSTIEEDFINTAVKLLGVREQPCKFKVDYSNSDKELLVQLSDLHIGKGVDLPHNKYNFNVAKMRIEKFMNKIIEYGESFNITNITIALTGDIFNLDSYLDSLLTNETHRANAFVTGLDIIGEFLDNLSDSFENIKVIGVVGNESRIRTSEYQSNHDSIASNNFDTLLFKILKRTHPYINFIGECDKLFDIVTIKDKVIGLAHGDKFKHSADEVHKFKSRLIEQFNRNINYIIFGHIHSTLITPNYARSGSLVGSDEYAFNGLNISESKSSQNIYLIDDEITAIEVKL